MDFFDALNFSSTNEDGATEIAALSGARHILCVTGSGTRPLDLLVADPDTIVAIDANPAQNALLALKAAAIARFDRADCLAFLGLAPDAARGERYDALRGDLTPAARAYWDRHRRLIASGVWAAGKWERLLGWNARFLRLFRGGAVDALMAAPTIAAQAAIWDAHFTGGRVLKAIETIGRDWMWRWVMREPAGAFLPSPRAVSERLAMDFARASRTFLFRESEIATLVLRGRNRADGALPVHLRAESYDLVRARLSRLRIRDAMLADPGGPDGERFDGFSLSDFGSYCGADDYAACWRGIRSVAAPGARYCERIFMNEQPPPFPDIAIDRPLSERLSRDDRAIVYRVRAGTIGGGGGR